MNKLTLGLLALLLCFGVVMADPIEADTTKGDTDKYDFTSGDNFTTEGGNVTEANATLNVSTEKWSGLYGDVDDGSILLADNSNNIFYEWTWTPASGGKICAVAGSVSDWSTISAAAATAINTVWGFAAGDEDDAVDTFDQTDAFTFAGTTVSATAAADTGPNVVADAFRTYLLNISGAAPNAGDKTDLAFCANLSAGGTNFMNGSSDYEVIVATNETIGQTEDYYLYLELD